MQWPLPTRKPKLVAPPGACDTHIHFFDAKYPKHPDGPTRRLTPRSPTTASCRRSWAPSA